MLASRPAGSSSKRTRTTRTSTPSLYGLLSLTIVILSETKNLNLYVRHF